MGSHSVPFTSYSQPDILRLIQELAVYEKEPDAVTATPELVSRMMQARDIVTMFITRGLTFVLDQGKRVCQEVRGMPLGQGRR